MTSRTLIFLLIVASSGCAVPLENRNPLGEPFPKVTGSSLEQESKALPDDYIGSPLVVLVGFTQDSQFDIDRWILGLVQAEANVRIIEVPTIPGLIPGMIANRIDEGMRRGIPREDWEAVITIYEGGEQIVEFLGNTKPNNARVLLLDSQGIVRWSKSDGYSAGGVLSLLQALETVQLP